MSINILGITPAASAPAAPQEKINVPVVQEAGIAAAAATDPVIELLKQLLPIDNPIGMLLEKFRQAAALSNTETPDEHSFAEVIELLRNLPVDLKNVTGEQLRTVIDRLGLRYEPMLEAAFSQRIPLAAPQLTAQNLKAALLQFLATPLPPSTGSLVPAETSAVTPEVGRRHVLDTLGILAQENLETVLVKQLEVQSRTGATAEVKQMSSNARTGSVEPETPAQAQLLTKVLTVLEAQASPQLKSALMQVLKASSANQQPSTTPSSSSATTAGPSFERPSSAEQPLTITNMKQAIVNLSPSGVQEFVERILTHSDPELKANLIQTLHAVVARDNEKTGAVAQSFEMPEGPLAPQGQQAGARPDQLPVRQTAEQVPGQPATKTPLSSVGNSNTISRSPEWPVSAGSVVGTVREQAHELLTAIERTQVLNSINGERGQSVTFQIPIVLDSQTSTAQFYVEQRPDEARAVPPEERHYTVVALLDLSGLGQLRIDLALYRHNLSVKVTVERIDVETFANQLLPDLGEGLKARGFSLEFLKCERKTEGSPGASELRGRTLPQNVVNLRV